MIRNEWVLELGKEKKNRLGYRVWVIEWVIKNGLYRMGYREWGYGEWVIENGVMENGLQKKIEWVIENGL